MHILVMELIDCLDVAKDDFLLSFESLRKIRFMHFLLVALHKKGGHDSCSQIKSPLATHPHKVTF